VHSGLTFREEEREAWATMGIQMPMALLITHVVYAFGIKAQLTPDHISTGGLPYVSNNEWYGFDDDVYHRNAGSYPEGFDHSQEDYEYYGEPGTNEEANPIDYDELADEGIEAEEGFCGLCSITCSYPCLDPPVVEIAEDSPTLAPTLAPTEDTRQREFEEALALNQLSLAQSSGSYAGDGDGDDTDFDTPAHYDKPEEITATPCSDDEHDCDTASTFCAATTDHDSGFFCLCLEGFERLEGGARTYCTTVGEASNGTDEYRDGGGSYEGAGEDTTLPVTVATTPCTDGSHGCDTTSTYCVETHWHNSGYLCLCLPGFYRSKNSDGEWRARATEGTDDHSKCIDRNSRDYIPSATSIDAYGSLVSEVVPDSEVVAGEYSMGDDGPGSTELLKAGEQRFKQIDRSAHNRYGSKFARYSTAGLASVILATVTLIAWRRREHASVEVEATPAADSIGTCHVGLV
jgi:hypothetical protein